MTVSMWINGMRPRTLPASIAPVLVGAAAAWNHIADRHWSSCARSSGTDADGCATAFDAVGITEAWFWLAFAMCLVVALALQVAVNFANDYSDGIRGTDAGRGAAVAGDRHSKSGDAAGTGPVRLVASGVNPKHVLAAAGIAAAVACAAGLVVIIGGQRWWLLAVGVASLLAGWFYTGGKHPYGYAGYGEIFVFVFFGLVATVGTCYAITGSFMADYLWAGAIAAGLNAVVLLMVNNIRDIPSDRQSGKRTYAACVGLGKATMSLYGVLALSVLLGVMNFWTIPMLWNGEAVSGAVMVLPLMYAVYVGMCVRAYEYRQALNSAGLYTLLSALCWAVVFVGHAQYFAVL